MDHGYIATYFTLHTHVITHTQATFPSFLAWEMNLTLGFGENTKTKLALMLNKAPPPELSAMSQEDWEQLVVCLQEYIHRHPFYGCPSFETVYFCCPGGPAQYLFCLVNPLTWCLYSKLDRQKDELVYQANQILYKYGGKISRPTFTNIVSIRSIS